MSGLRFSHSNVLFRPFNNLDTAIYLFLIDTRTNSHSRCRRTTPFSQLPLLFFLFFKKKEFEDETILERVAALQGMFPKPVQKAIGAVGSTTSYIASNSLGWSKKLMWLGASNVFLLVLPFQMLAELDRQSFSLEQRLSGVDTQQNVLFGGGGGGESGSTPAPAMA